MLLCPPHFICVLTPHSRTTATSGPDPAAPVEPIEAVKSSGVSVSFIVVEANIHCLILVTWELVVLGKIWTMEKSTGLAFFVACNLSMVEHCSVDQTAQACRGRPEGQHCTLVFDE